MRGADPLGHLGLHQLLRHRPHRLAITSPCSSSSSSRTTSSIVILSRPAIAGRLFAREAARDLEEAHPRCPPVRTGPRQPRHCGRTASVNPGQRGAVAASFCPGSVRLRPPASSSERSQPPCAWQTAGRAACGARASRDPHHQRRRPSTPRPMRPPAAAGRRPATCRGREVCRAYASVAHSNSSHHRTRQHPRSWKQSRSTLILCRWAPFFDRSEQKLRPAGLRPRRRRTAHTAYAAAALAGRLPPRTMSVPPVIAENSDNHEG
jgi:hypothetical protein